MRNYVIGMLLLSLLAGARRSEAEGNIHLGNLQIDPYASVSESWTDNVYYTPTDEKGDRILVFQPGIKLQFPFGQHRIEAEYFVSFNRYNKYTGEDTTDKTGRGLLDFRFGSSLGLTLTELYTKNHVDRGQSATGFIEVYRENASKASAFYQLTGRSKVQVDYSHTSYNYMISNFQDRDENFIAGYLYYRFLPKTSVFVEYDRKGVDFTLAQNAPGGVSLNNTQDSVFLGFTWEATAASRGTVKGGRTKKDFESPFVRDLTMWSWYLDIDHRFSDLTSLKIAGKRVPNETDWFGTSYYITTGASADLTHRMFSKTDLLLSGSYGTDYYSNGRKDTTTILGGGLKYWIRDWFDVSAQYREQKRDSNLPTAEYTEHRYIIGLDMVF